MFKPIPDKDSATTWLKILYALYVIPSILFGALMLVRVLPLGAARSFRIIFLDVWVDLWLAGFVIFPLYIGIFNRLYDRLRPLDFAFLCTPVIVWALITFGIKDSGARMHLLVESELVMILTGAYFLIVPITSRFPSATRSLISAMLLAVILTCVVLIGNSTPFINGPH